MKFFLIAFIAIGIVQVFAAPAATNSTVVEVAPEDIDDSDDENTIRVCIIDEDGTEDSDSALDKASDDDNDKSKTTRSGPFGMFKIFKMLTDFLKKLHSGTPFHAVQFNATESGPNATESGPNATIISPEDTATIQSGHTLSEIIPSEASASVSTATPNSPSANTLIETVAPPAPEPATVPAPVPAAVTSEHIDASPSAAIAA